MDGQRVRIEENWSGDVEVKTDGTPIAIVKANDLTFKTTIRMEENIHASSALFGIAALMYFMYKIYKDETEFMEDLLFDW